MSIPLILLAIGSLFVGYVTKDMIIGLGTPFWGHSIFILTENVTFLEAEYLPYHIKMIPFIFSHLGIFVAYNTTFLLSPSANKGKESKGTLMQSDLSVQKNISFFIFHTKPFIIKIYTFFNQKWHFDDFYNRFFVQKFINFGYHISFKLFDAGWIAYCGPYGLSYMVTNFAKMIGKLQTGYVYHYALILVFTIKIFVIYIFLSTGLLEITQPALIFILIIAFFFLSKSSFNTLTFGTKHNIKDL